MSGNKLITISNTGINFSRYFIHPDYENQEFITKSEIAFELYFDFKMGKRDFKRDEIIIKHNIKLFRKSDKLHISGLITESTFLVTSKMSFKEKVHVLDEIVNMNIGHMLGGWIVKQENISMSLILPDNFFRLGMIEAGMKEFVFKQWN